MRWLRWVFRILLLFVIGVPLALVGAVVASFEDRPTVVRPLEITPQQTERAKRLLGAHDPRKLPLEVVRTFAITREDLDLGLNVLLSQRGGAAQIALVPGTLMLWASVKAPANPFGAYWNVEATVRQTASLPEFDQLRIGRVPVPAFAADWLLQRLLVSLNESEDGKLAADVIRSVRIDANQLQVEYQWRADLPERLRQALVSAEEKARLHAYQEMLASVTEGAAKPSRMSIAGLLKPLFQLAADRSARSDPAAENRAALVVLALYVNGYGLSGIVPESSAWARPTPRKITLSERYDLAQHFSISAALAAAAGTPLANAIGLYKELKDAQGGSGFSFTDLAADRAGTLLGERAVASGSSARLMQRHLADGPVEADFMPPARDLPEGLSEAEFKRRFGGADSASYRELAQQIERRLQGLALYR